MFIKQISVYLENSKGTLRALTKTLSDAGINMLALSVADTMQFGLARVIVKDCEVDKAKDALLANGFLTKINSVICVACPNVSGGLDNVLKVIEDNSISIEYMYHLYKSMEGNALIVLRLSADGIEKEDIAKLLVNNGVKLVSQEEVDKQ